VTRKPLEAAAPGEVMYEHRRQPPLSRRAFAWRLARHAGVAALVVLGSLAGGMAGYVHFERLGGLDAFLNAAMLLGGMGPITVPVTTGGKLFAGTYSLYCGLIVVVVWGIMLAPVAHRVIHRFHWDKLA
jgi:hypothetical protein